MTVDVRARSPLDGRGGDLGRLGARELAFLTQITVRTATPTADLPTTPNAWLERDGREALWLGPDEWLVVASPWSAAEVLRDLEGSLSTDGSLVDVSANRAVIEIVGPGRFGLLTHGCGLDLDPRSWSAGRCAQTLLARVPVLLQERGDVTRVFVRPSFANHLVDWLVSL